MISKLLSSLVLLACIAVAIGFVVLAAWDVPVAQKMVEQPVDTSVFLERKS
ncbi:MAG: hypothetical protein KAI76_08005 [Alphaproteobacteria bacterium]|nr:hypothetical protein [Alphaproteobacteria bacterium]